MGFISNWEMHPKYRRRSAMKYCCLVHNAWKHSPHAGSCSRSNFSFSQASTRVFITVWKHGECFLFFKCNTKSACFYEHAYFFFHFSLP